MDPYNPDLAQDIFYHFNNLKVKLCKIKIKYNKDRAIVNQIDDLLNDCEFIEFIIKKYDTKNFLHLCNKINSSFSDPNSHGVLAHIIKKRFAENYRGDKLNYITVIV